MGNPFLNAKIMNLCVPKEQIGMEHFQIDKSWDSHRSVLKSCNGSSQLYNLLKRWHYMQRFLEKELICLKLLKRCKKFNQLL